MLKIGKRISEKLARRRVAKFKSLEAVLPQLSHDAREYAIALVDWLLRAQEATPDDGVAEGYKVLSGSWSPSYPETTGYIVCSLLNAAELEIGDAERLKIAASRMGNWLVSTQLDCGAFPGGNIQIESKVATVFNTGQILSGLTDLISHNLDSDGRFAKSADRAARWLVEIQDDDGAWRQGRSPLTNGELHSYDVLVANALCKYGVANNDDDAVGAAVCNADFLCESKEKDDWFPNMSFLPGMPPYTHTVAYTIQGLLELGITCNRSDFVDTASRAADQIRSLANEQMGFVPGQIDTGYQSASDWTSSTGNAQMAIVWMRLGKITGDASWMKSAQRALGFNSRLQELDMGNRQGSYRGAIRGSFPGHLGYGKFWFMNWTQKYQLDGLIMLIEEEVELK